ncbi:hypothetical protein TNIN_164471 [Trichonephila inaurata madagascariensis]|uniref:THO complex subunit 7 n=1 Tax=Trichonephila inaurata madagascariensis TaxID=2747483 RepID=A0A8X6M6L5_9ARAC|nr:hypothetical protein TNIN_164471 [Trichonephila inaurata madagascariensis]
MSFALPGPSGFFVEDVFTRMMDNEDVEDSEKFDLLLKTFFAWCSATRPHDIAEGYKKLTAIINNLQLHCSKSAETQKANARQIEAYDEQYATIEQNIVALRKVHAKTAPLLNLAKKAGVKKMKYDGIAKIILQLPDRKESMKQLEKIQGEIDILKLEKDVLSNKLNEQQKHLSLLLTSAIEMKNKLQEEEPGDWDSCESD